MGQLRAVADGGVLDFHVVADLDVVADDRIGPEVDEGSDFAAVFDFAVVGVRKLKVVAAAHDNVRHADVRADLAVFADDGAAFQDRSRIQDRIAAYGNGRIDVGVIGIDDRHAVCHELFQLAAAQHLFGFGHLQARVDAQRFFIIRCGKGADDLAGIDEHADDIGQVILALGVVVRHVMKHLPQEFHVEAVNTGVDFAHG